ncbi:putative quinol monooxygenase [Flavitalea flava]
METTVRQEKDQKPQLGFLIQFEAKDGKAEEVAQAMRNALTVIEEETGTIVWFAFRTSETGFGVFDAFYDEQARNAHWEAGSKGLEKIAPYIDQASLVIKKTDIVQAKLNQK